MAHNADSTSFTKQKAKFQGSFRPRSYTIMNINNLSCSSTAAILRTVLAGCLLAFWLGRIEAAERPDQGPALSAIIAQYGLDNPNSHPAADAKAAGLEKQAAELERQGNAQIKTRDTRSNLTGRVTSNKHIRDRGQRNLTLAAGLRDEAREIRKGIKQVVDGLDQKALLPRALKVHDLTGPDGRVIHAQIIESSGDQLLIRRDDGRYFMLSDAQLKPESLAYARSYLDAAVAANTGAEVDPLPEAPLPEKDGSPKMDTKKLELANARLKHAEIVDPKHWEEAETLPLLSPYGALFIPREWVLQRVEPSRSWRCKGIEAHFNDPDAFIKGAGAPISGEEIASIKVLRNVDELNENIHLLGETSLYKDEFVKRLKNAPVVEIGGHLYHVAKQIGESKRLDPTQVNSRRHFACIEAMPTDRTLPVFSIYVWGSSADDRDHLCSSVEEFMSNAAIGSLDPTLVIENWGMLENLHQIPRSPRPADRVVESLFREEELSPSDSAIMRITNHDFPLQGESFQNARLRLGVEDDAIEQIGENFFFFTDRSKILSVTRQLDGGPTKTLYVYNITIIGMMSPTTGRVGLWQLTTNELTRVREAGVKGSHPPSLQEFSAICDHARNMLTLNGGIEFKQFSAVEAGGRGEGTPDGWIDRGREIWKSTDGSMSLAIAFGDELESDTSQVTEMDLLVVEQDCIALIHSYGAALESVRLRLMDRN